jgi:hypothetical protein
MAAILPALVKQLIREFMGFFRLRSLAGPVRLVRSSL